MPEPARVAVITGASRGIGKAIALELARCGFDIVPTARSVQEKDTTPWPGSIEETAAGARKLGRRALPIRLDLNSMDDVRAVVARAMKEFGRIDVMVNNGRYIGKGHMAWFVETEWEELEQMVNTNVRAVLLFHHLIVPIMVKQGGGLFINVTAGGAYNESGLLPGKGATGLGYPVTKSAFHRIASALAKEVRQHNIAVVNLSPGHTMTERLAAIPGAGFDRSKAHPVTVPAVAARYIATCANPLAFSGKSIEAKDFVLAMGLMREGEMGRRTEG